MSGGASPLWLALALLAFYLGALNTILARVAGTRMRGAWAACGAS